MAKFKVGDKVKIIQRKKNNTTGILPGFNKPNGNVGQIGYVTKIQGNYCIYTTKDEKGYLGWFDEDDFELVSEEFALPEKWCIKLTEENVDVLGKWRSSGPLKDPKYAKEGWYLHTPKYSANGYNEPSKDPDYTEITFEQFKQHVLKESPVVETPKEENYVGRTIKALDNHPEGTNVKRGEKIKIKEINDDNRFYTLEKTKVGTEGMVINKPLNLYNWELISEDDVDMKAIYDVTTLQKKEKSIPEYVECVRGLNNATVGKIYKVIDASYCESNSPAQKYNWQTTDYKPSTKEAYEAQNAISAEYIPQVGDYVVMENAGGWGYHPDNNGCIAIVEKVSTTEVGYSSKLATVPSIGGTIINPKKLSATVFTNVPIIGHEKELVFRKALPHEIPSDLPKKTVIEEWEPGTYAVGVKGNFGIFSGSRHPISVGYIYIIKENIKHEVVVEGKEFWVYKENLKWFATREEAETFSKTLLKTEESPLEICRERYKKGMVVQSAEGSGMYSGTFTINVDPEKFTKTGDSVDYFRSEGFLYLEGKYAKILSYPGEKSKLENSKGPSNPIVEERINTPSIKKETFIEDVQSVSVMLRTKKKSIKF